MNECGKYSQRNIIREDATIKIPMHVFMEGRLWDLCEVKRKKISPEEIHNRDFSKYAVNWATFKRFIMILSELSWEELRLDKWETNIECT